MLWLAVTAEMVGVALLIVIDELVLAAIPEWVTSDAVTVWPPEVFRVTLNVCVPALRAALTGSTALASLEVMAAVSLVLITFQLASTALTVTVKAAPMVCELGVPVLPLPVPGAAVLPGASTWNCAKAAAL